MNLGTDHDFAGTDHDFPADSRENPGLSPGWRARLALRFERRDARSVLAERQHDGPLVVQKPLYPEGDEVCHVLVIHPPNGIAGGDDLQINASVGEAGFSVMATPGAGKWYQSSRLDARQDLVFALARGARLEWLPQETILYEGARARMQARVELAENAAYLGWEIVSLGHRGPDNGWHAGTAQLSTTITRAGQPLFHERGRFDARDPLMASPVGLAGRTVCGTLLGVPVEGEPAMREEVLAACRACEPSEGEGGITAMPGMIVARYLGMSTEAAKNYFTQLRRLLRPVILGREAMDLRIWRT